MNTIHRPYRQQDDPDRNWKTRMAAQELENARHERNARLAEFWTDVFRIVGMSAIVAWFLSIAYRDGLFDFLKGAF